MAALDRALMDWDGEEMILQIYGLDNECKKTALPKDPFLIRKSIEKHVGKIEGGFPEEDEASYALKVR